MMPAEVSPPTKRRKLRNNKSDKKEWTKSFCKHGDDRKKVVEDVRDRLQNVTVAFYSASEVALLDKKNKKNKNGGNDLKQGDKDTSQTCYSFLKKRKEGLHEAPNVSHRGHLKHRPSYSSYRCSSLSKMQNLIDLLPHSRFHSVRKRTPFSSKLDHFGSDASLYLCNGLDSEPELGAQTNRGTYLAVPISVGVAQRGMFSLFSQTSERNVAESEILTLSGVERKHSEKKNHNLDFKGSLLDEGGVKLRGKFTRAYVRKKYRTPFFKDEGPDFYALHLLADAATCLGSDPKFEVQVKQLKGTSVNGCNKHGPISTNNNSHMVRDFAGRNGGSASTSKAASVHQKASQSDEVYPSRKVSPSADLPTCTSINEDFNQNIKRKDKISRDDINIGSRMDELHLAEEVATNANQNAKDAENGLIDCHISMYAQSPTLEDVQINESNVKDAAKLSSAASKHEVATNANQNAKDAENELINYHNSMYARSPTLEDVQVSKSNDKDAAKLSPVASKNDVFLPEHGKGIDETFVGKNDTELERDSKYFREQHSVFVSKDSICHDKVCSFWCQLEPCNTCRGKSQPNLRCMETLQMSEGCPSSSSTTSVFNGSWENSQNAKACSISFIRDNLISSPGYQVRRILQSSRQKAIRMVDAAMKVMSSIKVGEDAYAMIGRALDSAEIQQIVIPSKILRTQRCVNPQNGVPGNCPLDIPCNPAEVAAAAPLINSTVPTLTQNDSQVLPKLISACVAALLMIQASGDTRLPPAEAMEILEHAARDLRPHYSQNLHIYREIEDLMGIIKTQVLTFVRTPTSNGLHS